MTWIINITFDLYAEIIPEFITFRNFVNISVDRNRNGREIFLKFEEDYKLFKLINYILPRYL